MVIKGFPDYDNQCFFKDTHASPLQKSDITKQKNYAQNIILVLF